MATNLATPDIVEGCLHREHCAPARIRRTGCQGVVR